MRNATTAADRTAALTDDETNDFQTLSRWLRDGSSLRDTSTAMLGLSAAAWALFLAIYSFLWGKREAWPTQARLAVLTGWCLRVLRDALRELEAAGVFVVEYRPRPGRLGGYRIVYHPGRALYAALLAKRERARAKRLGVGLPPPGAGHTEPPRLAPPPTVTPRENAPDEGGACGTACREHAAPGADDLDLREIESRVSSRTRETTPPKPSPVAPVLPEAKGCTEGRGESEGSEPALAPPASVVVLEDARIAAELLGYRLTLAHPEARPAPPEAGPLLAMATARVAELGDLPAKEKLRRGRLAVEAAHRRSLRKTGRPPSSGYIFGTQGFFLGHVERGLAEAGGTGRSRAVEAARQGVEEAPRASEPARGTDPTPDRLFARLRGAQTLDEAPSRPSRAEVAAFAREASAAFDAADEARRLEAVRRKARADAASLAEAFAEDDARAAAGTPPVPLGPEALARARAEVLAELDPELRRRLEARGVALSV